MISADYHLLLKSACIFCRLILIVLWHRLRQLVARVQLEMHKGQPLLSRDSLRSTLKWQVMYLVLYHIRV